MKNKELFENNEEMHFDGIERKNVFSTPSEYFDQLPDQISNKISALTSRESGLLFNQHRLLFATAIVIAAIFTGSLYFINSGSDEKSHVILSYDDLIGSGMVDEFENSMLIEHYISLQSESLSEHSDTSNKSSMNEYLIENDIDITLIINEL